MRRLLFFVLLAYRQFDLYGQVNLGLEQKTIPLHFREQSADELLKEVGRQLNASVSYNTDYLKKETITIQSDTLTLREVIDSLFIKGSLKFRLIGHQLVVYEPSGEGLLLDSCYQTMKAKLIDSFTEQPIVHASVKELISNQMTVSNRDGVFILKIPCDTENTQLEISALGYKSRFLVQPIAEEIASIQLEGDYVPLKEIYIINVYAEQLVGEVLTNVSNNYLDRPSRSTSFFREAVLKNNTLVAMSEAVFDVYNHPYDGAAKKDQAQLIRGRKFIDYENIDTVGFKIKGSLRSCFKLDVVKQLPFFFNEASYKDYFEYTFNGVRELNGKSIYVIGFKYRGMSSEQIPYVGKMYIDNEQKSLVAIQFEVNKRSLRNTEHHFILRKSKNLKTKLQNVSYYVQYTDVGGKLAMNYVAFTNEFKIKKKKSMFSSRYKTIAEYVVNKFETENIHRIRNRNAFAAETIFMDEPIEYNDDYWEGINYLPIDKPLLESSDELQKIFTTVRK